MTEYDGLEYEFLYTIRDQVLIFQKMRPEGSEGYTDDLLAWLDDKVELLGKRGMRERFWEQ